MNRKATSLESVLQRFHLTLNSEKDEQGNSLLIIATKLGDNEIVKILLEHGVDPNIRNKCGNTALHYAINYGYRKIRDMLLVYQANEELENAKGLTPWQCQ